MATFRCGGRSRTHGPVMRAGGDRLARPLLSVALLRESLLSARALVAQKWKNDGHLHTIVLSLVRFRVSCPSNCGTEYQIRQQNRIEVTYE